MDDEFFNECMMMMLHHEGMDLEKGKTGFVQDPQDNDGGATNYGITMFTYADYMQRKVTVEEMKNMPFEHVKEIYKERYWDKARCSEMPHKGLAYMVFDAYVNMGNRSAKILQGIVGASKDGVLGQKSMHLVKGQNSRYMMDQFYEKRQAFYERLNKPRFIKGWTRRNKEVYEKAKKMGS